MPPVTATTTRVPGGDAQTRATLRRMAECVNAALYQPEVIGTAVDIVRGVNGRDADGLAAALRDWLEARVAFLPDPLIDGDVLRVPSYSLAEIRQHGVARIDCDDAAMLSAALAKSIGLPARFRVLGFPRWAHVYTEVLTQHGWAPLDVTESVERRAWAARQANARAATWVV